MLSYRGIATALFGASSCIPSYHYLFYSWARSSSATKLDTLTTSGCMKHVLSLASKVDHFSNADKEERRR